MNARSNRLVVGLAGCQFADAVFNAVALYDLAPSSGWGRWAKEWAEDDLEHLGFPERLRFLFPIIKASSAVGLIVGLRRPRLGRLTAGALVAYFVVAVGFHLRAGDSLTQFGPAVGMLGWSELARRGLSAADAAS